MKKSLLAIGFVTILLSSCKKDKQEEFVATDRTGTTTLSGTVTRNQLTPNQGLGMVTIAVPAPGVVVTVKINNNQLYPNSPTAVGSEVYSGTTDANGKYTISVKTIGGNGATASIIVHDFVSTIDTIVNGVPKTGQQANFTGITFTRQLITGVASEYNYYFVGTPIIGTTNPITIGTATVSGTLEIEHWTEDTAGGVSFYTLEPYALANHTVKLVFDKDPTTQEDRTYTTTTNSSGKYTFVIETTDASGFNNDAEITVVDYARTQDTVLLNGTTITGDYGVYDDETINVFSIDPTEIRLSEDILYDSFTPQ